MADRYHAAVDGGRPPLEPIVAGFEEARAGTAGLVADALARLHLPRTASDAERRGFGSDLARCLEDREASELAEAIAELHIEDLWLAYRARRGAPDAVAEFEKQCIDPLGPTIGRVNSSEGFVDEVRQRVRTKLLVAEPGKSPKLERYRGRGELNTWIRVVAAREALTLARGDRGREPVDDDLLALEASTTGPELGVVKAQYSEAFGASFRETIADLSPEQRNILRLHYLHGMTIDDLGGLLKLHRSNAARRVAAARSELLAGTRRRLLLKLQMGREDFEAMMRLIASRIDVSIERFLGA